MSTTPDAPVTKHELTITGDGSLTIATLRRLVDAADTRAVPDTAAVHVRAEDSQRDGAYWSATIGWAD